MALDTIQTKECGYCGEIFSKAATCSKSEWSKRQGCSQSCAAKLRGAPWLDSFKLKKGAQLGKRTQFKKGQTTGSKNTKWKGDKASYAAKHMWVRYHYGKADHCEDCKTEESRMYHWSNISGEYSRDRDDWQQLCVPCHKEYDLA